MRRISLLVGIVVLSLAPVHAGIVLDAAADWSITNGNPNGPWTYGYTTTAAYTTGTVGTITALDTGGAVVPGTFEAWTFSGTPASNSLFPHVTKNITGGNVPPGSVTYPNNVLAMHPQTDGFPLIAETAVVRLTVPVTGVYNSFFEFSSLDSALTADGVGIFIGLNVPADGLGGLVFLGAINSATPGPISSTAFGVNLTAGQTIDYLVWRGANGAQDSTGFRATLTQIPEPSTLILTTCGIAGLFFLRRRRFGQS